MCCTNSQTANYRYSTNKKNKEKVLITTSQKTIIIIIIIIIIKHSKFLLFADDLKIYGSIKFFKDCKALQAYIDSVQQWCV
jgi:hypothetical protein